MKYLIQIILLIFILCWTLNLLGQKELEPPCDKIAEKYDYALQIYLNETGNDKDKPDNNQLYKAITDLEAIDISKEATSECPKLRKKNAKLLKKLYASYCIDALYKNAERFYLEGDIFRAKNILEAININKVSNNECLNTKRDALVLLSKIYLLIGKDNDAINKYEKVLKIDPSYKLNERLEPTDMIYFANKYKAIPWISITPSISLVQTNIINRNRGNSIESIFANRNDGQVISTTFSSLPSYGGNLAFSIFPTKRWEILANFGINQQHYEMNQLYNRFGIDNAQRELLTIEEYQFWLNSSGIIRYNLGKRGFRFNVFLGRERNRLLSAYWENASRGGFDLIEELDDLANNNKPTYFNDDNNDIDVMKLREEKNTSIVYGIGLKYRPSGSRRHFITMDFKRATHQNNFTKTVIENANDADDLSKVLIFGLGYIDDYMKLRYTQISVGYAYTIYQVRDKDKRFSLFK